MSNLTNCSRCGKLFVKTTRNICPNCMQLVEEDYKLCVEYLRENKLINIYDLSENTGVTVKQITAFIKEGRISVADLPNFGYPCESCGTPIREGRFCKKCSDHLTKGFKNAFETGNTKEEESPRSSTYYQFKDRFK